MTTIWYLEPVSPPDNDLANQARQRQDELTKPPGSLGRIESLAIALSAMQGRLLPRLDHIAVVVFAADHGIAEEGVSAFPQAVTAEMIKNFARGGAAISVLARQLEARLEVVDVGSAHLNEPLPGVVDARIAPATRNFLHEPAMSHAQCIQAMDAGRAALERAWQAGTELFIGGEMGIANTTAATALLSIWLKRPASELVGPGTGLDEAGMRHKAEIIEQAIHRDNALLSGPLSVLAGFGGFEIAALCGAYIAAAQAGMPILIDGFISSVALLAAEKLNPGVRQWCFFSHRSAEPGHRHVCDALDAEPLLDLGMRLGEGSGAAIAAGLLKSACALHTNMATFAEAGVSSGEQ